ncbi:MAG: hypothetical protein WCX73_03590 [Candidatus Pacearchaeota archaeon]|jgi:hypothetical protein
MKAKINIQSRKEETDRQKKDITTYCNMVEELLGKINEKGLHMSWHEPKKEERDLSKKNTPAKNLEISAEVIPVSIFEGQNLTDLVINVHKQEVFDIVKNVAQKYANQYNNLERININTYF